MNSTDKIYRYTFENILAEHGFIFQVHADNMYSFTQVDEPGRITAQFIASEPIDELIHGSHNGNKIQAIGYFKFRLPPPGVSEQDFFIFGFYNPPKDCIEFLIIPTSEMKRRLQSKNRTKIEPQIIELQFWLLENNYVFETFSISLEGEWWFINGRMGEQSDYDYTEFHNGWNLSMK